MGTPAAGFLVADSHRDERRLLPANVRLLGPARRQLRALREEDREAFAAVVGVLSFLGELGSLRETRRYIVSLPASAGLLLLHGLEAGQRRVLFARTTSAASGESVYLVWLIVKSSSIL